MKKLILAICILLCIPAVEAQSIKFHDITYAEALKMSKKENKAIFIDLYTSWCGPCKSMEKNIFTLPVIGNLYNENFICLKYDAEKNKDGQMLTKNFKVTAYPTMLFVDRNGELVYRIVGGRDEKGFLAEGEKAKLSFDNMGTLKKMDKRYAKGKKDLKFLTEYYAAKSASSLDCGPLLLDLYKLYSDEDVLKSENVGKVAEMTVYDKALLNRLVKLLTVYNGKTDVINKKDYTSFSSGMKKYLSITVRKATIDDDFEMFNDIMDIRRDYMSIKGNIPSVTGATMGGGNIMLPEELIRLDYYKSSDTRNSEFIALMENYIEEHLIDGAKKTIDMSIMIDAAKKKAESNPNKKAEIKRLNGMQSMMRLFIGADLYFASANLVSYIERYEKVYKGVKDKVFNDKIIRWYYDLATVMPSPKIANSASGFLVAKGAKDKAIKAIELGLKKGKESFSTNLNDIEESENLLKELNL